ncbi:hypothetical protein [Erythrobacter aureus]|uniref:hypothetical protein n=1 Tax=Erythrobacter aureus TaxID=2182384 RepID=UPI003A926B97
MSETKKLSARFEELSKQLEAVFSTKQQKESRYSDGIYVDHEAFLNWSVKAKNLLTKACGEESLHVKEFLENSSPKGYTTNHGILIRLRAVFNAAREDFDGGYCTSVRSLVRAELFDDELEQASELLDAGYTTAAAVVAGVVLETTMRQLCDENGISHGKLDKMNADLAKVGQYNILQQKRITTLADVRNSAAHGKVENFSEADVREMISQVRSFVLDSMS